MDKRIAEFRKIAARVRNGRKSGSRPYPEKAKELATAFARERAAAGDSYSSIASKLGIAQTTITAWLEPASAGFRRVRVHSEKRLAANGRLVMVTGSGIRVEGLDVAGVVQILGALR